MSPPADPLLDRMPAIGGTLTEGAQIGTTLDPRPERINDVRSWSAITTQSKARVATRRPGRRLDSPTAGP
jgi:hypothetical protein